MYAPESNRIEQNIAQHQMDDGETVNTHTHTPFRHHGISSLPFIRPSPDELTQLQISHNLHGII